MQIRGFKHNLFNAEEKGIDHEHIENLIEDYLVQHSFQVKILDSFPERESEEIEYKSAEGGFPDEFWKTYSAFANTSGGVVVFGVKEVKGKVSFLGLSEEKIHSLTKIFWDQANNKQRISANIVSSEDVSIIDYKDKKFLAIRIRAASRQEKPIHVTLNPIENTYKRNYEGDYRCTREEVRRMLADADTTHHYDNRILENFTIDDFDAASIRQYRTLFANLRPGHPWLSLDNKEFLVKLGAYGTDRRRKVEGPTVGGMLMFGLYSSITDPECCPNFFPDFREILSSDPDVRWTDRIYPDGSWEPNLFQFYKVILPKLASRLPKPFQLLGTQRNDETPAHIALREALVNVLIHTDYSAPGHIIIEQRPDTFKFTNPGTLLVTLHQYYEGGFSECRNLNLQKMFMMVGSAEKAGSGVNKILSGWSYAHWRTPQLSIESKPDRIILELPMSSTLPEDTLVRLKDMFGVGVDYLGGDELTILATCDIEGEITNTRLQFMLNMHKTDITRVLQELCKSGYLISENKRRWTTYRLNNTFVDEDKSSISLDEECISFLPEDKRSIELQQIAEINELKTFEDATERDSSDENKINWDSTKRDSSVEDSTKRDSSVEDSTKRDSSVEDGTKRDSSEDDSTNWDNPVEDGTNWDNPVEDSTIWDSSEDDSTHRDSSEDDSTHRDSSEENSTHRDSSEEGVVDVERASKRSSYDTLSLEIIKICEDYRSVEEISIEVGKSSKHLLNNIFPKMIAEGLLRRLYQENHPSQRYIAISQTMGK
ncbi:RNA-binding domain-containing protein [Flectobacillus roseus]|uniref:RNA-binding domain-containing protein n=1 Tax=Flectobacillus roseus TaxID=502259 RepID=UPI0024B7F6F5|nr:RNA-binding domain-containing protein [Flectobacillus roseus]MDI9871294.1 putative DNA binding domain-containing protein [Flectobacillus roseus]